MNRLPHFAFVLMLTAGFLLNGKTTFAQEDGKFVVVLDAGHGGKDPGRPTKYGWKEKDIALKIVLQVGELLEARHDIKIIYTRKTDVFLELRERAAIANKADADLFVSVHCNAHHTQAYGAETYVMALRSNNRNFDIAKKENEVIFLEDNYEKHYEGFDPNSPESLIGLSIMQEEYLDQSILLAKAVQDNFTYNLKRRNRGVKQAGFWVLHNTYMPSVLIETGFITNRNEGGYLNSKKGQYAFSREISNAIISYKKQLGNNVGESIGSAIDLPVIEEDEPTEEIPVEPKVYNNIVFKVQISASSKKLEPKPYNFNGLDNVSREKIDNLYKYYYGYTSDYNEIKRQQQQAKKKGYSSAFVVAFKDGVKIPLQQALE